MRPLLFSAAFSAAFSFYQWTDSIPAGIFILAMLAFVLNLVDYAKEVWSKKL